MTVSHKRCVSGLAVLVLTLKVLGPRAVRTAKEQLPDRAIDFLGRVRCIPGDGRPLAYGPNRLAIRDGDRRRPNVPLRQVQTRSSRRRCGGGAKRKGEEERGATGLNKLERRDHRRDHKKECSREKDGCARWGEQLGSRDQPLNM